MGWKVSLIIIEHKGKIPEDREILAALDVENAKFQENTLFEVHPNDRSVSIGVFENNTIIADDFRWTESFFTPRITEAEKGLLNLFPENEIIAVACHSVVNFHGYSVYQNGVKIRAKNIDSEKEEPESFGEILPEEKAIYYRSEIQDGKRVWIYPDWPDEPFFENQLMEEFTFEIARRRLKLRIDEMFDDDDIMQTEFMRKYIVPNKITAWVKDMKTKATKPWWKF